jgi:BTB/POZ domain
VEYLIEPTEEINIYPFVKREDVIRPTAGSWIPGNGHCKYEFVYFLPSNRDTKDRLFFIKYPNSWGPPEPEKLIYGGTVSVSAGRTVLNERLNHIRKMCRVLGRYQRTRLFEVVFAEIRPLFDILPNLWASYKRINELELRSGAILLLLPWNDSQRWHTVDKSVLQPYRKHRPWYIESAENEILSNRLFSQAMVTGEFCDVLLTSAPANTQSTFQFTLHKNVMAGIPYFQKLFASGMRESTRNGPMVKMVLPFYVTKAVCREFIYCAYMSNPDRIAKMGPYQLMQLLELGDYYQFEELVEYTQLKLHHSYSELTPKLALELLTLVQRLELSRKEDLQHMALTYVAFNFPDVAHLLEFREMEDERYGNILEYVARLGWDQNMYSRSGLLLGSQDLLDLS